MSEAVATQDMQSAPHRVEKPHPPDTRHSRSPFLLSTSRDFPRWLASLNSSLAFTTYQAGKIFFLGVGPDSKLSVSERTLPRVMGMCASSSEIYVSTLYQLWRFKNVLEPGQTYGGYDAVYIPRESRITGDLDIHDVAIDKEERIVFSNTLFNCLASTDREHNFRPLWKPRWISRLVAEDRCHLNGMALRDGKPRYVTAVSRSDVNDGWRDKRRTSGVVVDIETDDVVCEGLSMPHSPRWHDGQLWLINSGTGYFGRVDPRTGKFEPLVFCPGFARGLSFIGKYAVVGLSDRRKSRTFQDLELGDNLAAHDAETRCGLLIVDLATGGTPHWVRFEGVVKELYDVSVIPGIRRPLAIGFQGDEVRRYLSFAEPEQTATRAR